MALTREEKKVVVAEVADLAANAQSVVAVEYRGLTVGEMTGLRASARNEDVCLRVVKNNLARRAIEGGEFECLSEKLSGPLMLAFSREDPGSGARILRDFAKKNHKLVLLCGAFGGQLLSAAEVGKLADMPTREQAISMLMSVIQAPITKLVRTLNEVPGKLVRTLDAVREAKQAV